ncbi:MAG TPA: hypothetical protein VGG74_32325 [Kofleriaceae bacterium]|jgi:hypothetical protein
MDEQPITLPRPKVEPDFEISSPTRVADGTKTRLGAAARTTLPPPIPSAARRTKAKATIPPPIPAAALAAKPRGTTGTMHPAPADDVPVDPIIAPPPPSQEPSSKIAVAADIDVPIEHDESPDVALPPLPRPSQGWLATTTQPPPMRTDEPRRKITIAPQSAKPIAMTDEHEHDDESQTPLPPPAPEPDLADSWFVDQSSRVETSAVSDLFAPSPEDDAPVKDAKPAKEPSKPAIAIAPAPVPKRSALPAPAMPVPAMPAPSGASELFARPTAADIETSAIDASAPVDLFALPAPPAPPPAPIEEPSTNYFERTATYNKRHLAAVGVAAVCVAVLAAVLVRGALKPSKLATNVATASHAAPVAPVAPVETAPAPTPTPAETAPAPAPAPAPAAVAEAPVAAPAPAARTVDVPITSVPSGATVTLIENGVPRVLGKTPLFVSLDRAQAYDVVVALAGHPTSMQHVDAHVTSQVAVAFDGSHAAARAPAPAEVAAAAPAPAAPAEHHHHHVEARVAAADPVPSAPSPSSSHRSWNVAPAARPVAAETAGAANGVLMVASKPPCEIVIDGHPTKLETPQRSIALAPGTHAVTLINAKMHINKTVPVQVAANKPTKLIRDFTH